MKMVSYRSILEFLNAVCSCFSVFQKDASEEAVDQQPAEGGGSDAAAEEAGMTAGQDDGNREAPMEVSKNPEDGKEEESPEKGETSPVSKPMSVTPPPENSTSKRSSRR